MVPACGRPACGEAADGRRPAVPAQTTRHRVAVATLFDPTTFRHLERLGIGSGRRCWEVGAGGTSVVSWPAEKVGPTGQVVATDIDTSLLASVARPPVEVHVHDVSAEEPPGEGFDLVHARLVLVHVPDRERALRSMIKALRPSGRLLIEDADPALQPLVCPDEHGPEQRLADRLRHGFRRLLADRGAASHACSARPACAASRPMRTSLSPPRPARTSRPEGWSWPRPR
ncbi:hypothetical protein GCM10022403_027530 [Streptomyces coacervatus]|uniref:Methyltransferase domain-containing protein n=1 Tax=Streptomyces coacervatus TaxID=647381 RepID=A0ABP7HHJ8_9ACTN